MYSKATTAKRSVLLRTDRNGRPHPFTLADEERIRQAAMKRERKAALMERHAR